MVTGVFARFGSRVTHLDMEVEAVGPNLNQFGPSSLSGFVVGAVDVPRLLVYSHSSPKNEVKLRCDTCCAPARYPAQASKKHRCSSDLDVRSWLYEISVKKMWGVLHGKDI